MSRENKRQALEWKGHDAACGKKSFVNQEDKCCCLGLGSAIVLVDRHGALTQSATDRGLLPQLVIRYYV